MTAVTVAEFGDLVDGAGLRVDVDGHRLSVVRIADAVYVIGDRCTHADYSLSEGELFCDAKEIECWKHGSLFSIETGEALTLPATQPVPVFVASVVDGDVVIELEAGSSATASKGAAS